MRIHRRRYLSVLIGVLAIALLAPHAAFPDSREGERKVNPSADRVPLLALKSALDEALEHNAYLAAAQFEADSKEARIRPAGSLPDPAIEGRLTNYPVSSFSPREAGMTGNEVMLVQKFPFPGKRDQLSTIARQEYLAAEEDSKQARLSLIRQVKLAYYQLYLAFERERLLREQEKVLRDLEEIAQVKYSLSSALQSEVLELQLKAASIQISLEGERKNREAKTAELNHLLGRDAHLLSWKPESVNATPVDLTAVRATCVSADRLNENPSIHSLETLASASRSKVSYSELNAYPDFEVGIGYMQRFANRDDSGADFVSARVSITLPFWRGDKQDEERREARAEQKKREALLREGRVELSHALHEAVAELTESTNKLALYRNTILPLSDAAIQSAEKAYGAGQASLPSVLTLTNDRFNSKLDYVETLVQHESALATLEALLGVPAASFIPQGAKEK